MLALTHVPSPNLPRCQLTYVAAAPIDFARAAAQHRAYCQVLRDCGATDVRALDVNRDEPDGVFLEDTAVVLDEVAVIASMGTPARRAEVIGVEPELRKYREVRRVEPPATLEGGDVLRVGRRLLVGLSSRTNAAGIKAIEEIVRPFGYAVEAVPVRGCLHLKTACTALDERTLLVNPAWIDVNDLPAGSRHVTVADEEPWAANVLPFGGSILLAAGHDRTADVIRRLGFDPRTADISEFAKAEGGVTCLSILIAGP